MNSPAKKPPSKVVKDDRSLAGAYGMAFVGLVLGVLGMHRYYLKQRIYGTAMSGVFLFGVVLIFAEFAQKVSAILSGAVAFGSGGDANFGSIPDIPDISQMFSFSGASWEVYLGVGLCIIGTIWFVIDMFRLPWLTKEYREGR